MESYRILVSKILFPVNSINELTLLFISQRFEIRNINAVDSGTKVDMFAVRTHLYALV